jgi:hypothetical protein
MERNEASEFLIADDLLPRRDPDHLGHCYREP